MASIAPSCQGSDSEPCPDESGDDMTLRASAAASVRPRSLALGDRQDRRRWRVPAGGVETGRRSGAKRRRSDRNSAGSHRVALRAARGGTARHARSAHARAGDRRGAVRRGVRRRTRAPGPLRPGAWHLRRPARSDRYAAARTGGAARRRGGSRPAPTRDGTASPRRRSGRRRSLGDRRRGALPARARGGAARGRALPGRAPGAPGARAASVRGAPARRLPCGPPARTARGGPRDRGAADEAPTVGLAGAPALDAAQHVLRRRSSRERALGARAERPGRAPTAAAQGRCALGGRAGAAAARQHRPGADAARRIPGALATVHVVPARAVPGEAPCGRVALPGVCLVDHRLRYRCFTV